MTSDDKHLISLGKDGKCIIWDVDKGEQSQVVEVVKNDNPYHIGCLSHDDRYLYAVDKKNSVLQIDMLTGFTH